MRADFVGVMTCRLKGLDMKSMMEEKNRFFLNAHDKLVATFMAMATTNQSHNVIVDKLSLERSLLKDVSLS